MSPEEKEKLKAELKSQLTTFRRYKYVSRTERIEGDMMVTTHDLVIGLLKESIKKRYLVIRDGVGYEISDRRKWRFPNHGTPQQTKEQIKMFPWE